MVSSKLAITKFPFVTSQPSHSNEDCDLAAPKRFPRARTEPLAQRRSWRSVVVSFNHRAPTQPEETSGKLRPHTRTKGCLGMETRAPCRPPLVASGQREEEGPPLKWTERNFSLSLPNATFLYLVLLSLIPCLVTAAPLQKKKAEEISSTHRSGMQ